MNSDVVSDLYIYAEVSVALVGFAAIVGSIEQRNVEEMSTLRKSAYHSLLSSALVLILLAFVPIWLKYWTEDATLIWRSCFALLLILSALGTYSYFTTSKIDQVEYADVDIFDKIMAKLEYVFFPIGQSLNLVALACLLGFLESFYIQIYFTVLTYYLVLSVAGFMVLVTHRGK